MTGHLAPHVRHVLLQFQPREPRHAQIEQNAARRVEIGGFEKLLRRFVEHDLYPAADISRWTDVRQDASSSTTWTSRARDHAGCAVANGSVKWNDRAA